MDIPETLSFEEPDLDPELIFSVTYDPPSLRQEAHSSLR